MFIKWRRKLNIEIVFTEKADAKIDRGNRSGSARRLSNRSQNKIITSNKKMATQCVFCICSRLTTLYDVLANKPTGNHVGGADNC